MEHKLILGGNEFLPFARSCVTKLKKLGLSHASQAYEVGGVSIKVRLEPGHEYIRIEGGSELMQMDSGVVDMGYVYATPYANCKLHEVAANASYNAGFTTNLNTKNKVLKTDEVWKKNPSKLSAGQLSGDVYKEKSFRGRVPPDDQDARSFSARMDSVVADPPISPPDRQRVADDDNLLIKKFAATICPASVFTGKCRLYIQAMYGRPLYDYTDLDESGAPKLNEQPMPANPTDTGASPYLLVKSYKRNKSSPDFPDVTVSTNTGVYLDTETGKHWMINFGGDAKTLIICPLVGRNESMRRFLKKPEPGAAPKPDPLRVIDLDHLEAYILASCLPDMANKQVIDFVDPSGRYSLGYGWHWDWTGGNADIVTVGAKVKNEGVPWTDVITGEYYVQTSEHHRVTVKPTTTTDPDTGKTSTTWAATLAVVQPLTEWNVYRTMWSLLEPLWREGGFIKSFLPVQATRAMIFDANVPIYAFYKNDVLQTVRLDIKTSQPDEAELTHSNDSLRFTPSPTRTIRDLYSEGLSAEFAEYKGSGSLNVDGGRRIAVVLSCGSFQTPTLWYNLSTLGWRTDSSEKIITGGRDTGAVTVAGGYLGAIYDGDSPIEPTVAYSGSIVEMTYSITRNDVGEYTNSNAIFVVPRGDSEAMFVRAESRKQRVVTPADKWDMITGGFATWRRLADVTLVIDTPRQCTSSGCFTTWNYTYVDPGQSDADLEYRAAMTYTHPTTTVVQSVTPPAVTTNIPLGEVQVLLGASATPVSFPDIPEAYANNVDEVSAYTFVALSGTRVDIPTVFAPGRLAQTFEVPAIVGWL